LISYFSLIKLFLQPATECIARTYDIINKHYKIIRARKFIQSLFYVVYINTPLPLYLLAGIKNTSPTLS